MEPQTRSALAGSGQTLSATTVKKFHQFGNSLTVFCICLFLSQITACSNEPKKAEDDTAFAILETPPYTGATYLCEDGRELEAQFETRQASVLIAGYPVSLDQQAAEEGYYYQGQDISLHHYGDYAIFIVGGQQLRCERL